jgi:hypothetical protein
MFQYYPLSNPKKKPVATDPPKKIEGPMFKLLAKP